MQTASELQGKIISMIRGITNVEQLSAIHRNLQDSDEAVTLPWAGVIANTRPHLGFADLIAEQGPKSLSFEELSKLASDIAWEHSLDELLAMLD